jgi:hypothetical protein
VKQTEMTRDSTLEGAKSPANSTPEEGWLRMGLLAAASALAGGLAVAWYYRNTLTRLRQSEALEQDASPQDPVDDEGSGI